MTDPTTTPCHRPTDHCPTLRAHLRDAVVDLVPDRFAQCRTCGSMFLAGPLACPHCGAGPEDLSVEGELPAAPAVPAVIDPIIVKAARRVPQIEHELARSIVRHMRFGQCCACGSMFIDRPPACPHCQAEDLVSLDEDLPVGCYDDDYDDDGNLRDDVRTEGRPRYRPVSDDELREQLESEFGDSRPNLYEDVQNYLYRQGELRELGRRCRDRQHSLALVRRCRTRARRSHRVVRVTKTAAGDSGDGDPEPPTTRRGPSSGAASVERSTEHAPVPAQPSALVDLHTDLIGGGR